MVEPVQTMMQEANLVQLDKDPKSTFKTDGSGFASFYDHMFCVKEQTPEYIANSCNTLHVAKVAYGDASESTTRTARR